jgi:hypothetical protein
MRLIGNLNEKRDDIIPLGRSLLRSPKQLAIMRQRTKRVDPLPMR